MRPVFFLASVALSMGGAAAVDKGPNTASAKADYDQSVALAKKGDLPSAIAAAKRAIEEDPNLFVAHDQFLDLTSKVAYAVYQTKGVDAYEKASKESTQNLEDQYAAWSKQYPKSSGVMYGLGKMYSDEESPKARPYLLKALEADPKIASAYEMLSIDAERWGDERASREYMGKAAATDPSDAGYAFYYADMFRDSDPQKYVEMSLDVAKRFPDSERGAQARYWLGSNATSDADKIRFWEMGKTQFPPSKFDWSQDSAMMLFDAYARTEPQKALALAEEMKTIKGAGNDWQDNVTLAKNMIAVRQLLDNKDYAGAKTLLDGSKIGKYSSNAGMFALLKAEADAESGHVDGAYAALTGRYAKTPEDAVKAAIVKYGAVLGKSSDQVEQDVWTIRNANAKPAPSFDLDAYLSKGKRALSDYRGKVVLLTFWFPGCGPCRGEFPHFENVLKRFHGQPVQYVGINVLPEQDDYVRPFIKGTHYTFTPLREDGKQQETDYHVRGEPTNFLIDPAGRIVYSNFRAEDPESERVLELMIRSLLEHKVS